MFRRILCIFIFLPVLCTAQEFKNYDAFVALDMEKKEGFPVPDSIYKRLNEIIKALDSISFNNVTDRENALNICLSISNVLENRFGIYYENTYLLSEGLRNNHLDCNYFSILFYTVLKKHSQNAALVISPGHMFLRWYYNGNTYLNYETTENKAITDSEYIELFGISSLAIKNNLYMKPLTWAQEIAVGYLDMSNACGESQTLKQKTILNKALKLFPNLVMAYNGLAYTAVTENKTNEAISYLNKAIALDTLNYITYQWAGRIYQKAGQYNEALKYFTKGIQHNTIDPQSYIYRSRCYLEMDKVEEAMADFDKGSDLLKNGEFFKFLFDYLSLKNLEDKIMEKYIEIKK
jgi:tetratricopeptide (TPR) repeat protein